MTLMVRSYSLAWPGQRVLETGLRCRRVDPTGPATGVLSMGESSLCLQEHGLVADPEEDPSRIASLP